MGIGVQVFPLLRLILIIRKPIPGNTVFFVPHDISGLINLHGGSSPFNQKLNKLFGSNSTIEGRQQADITGLIGQYAHGNEPSHHMAYLYNSSGNPEKSQFMVNKILNELYHSSLLGFQE